MAFDRGRGFSQTVRFLEFCIDSVTYGGNISQSRVPPEGPGEAQSNPYEVDMQSWTWIPVNDRNDCEVLFDEFKQGNQELADLNNLDYLNSASSVTDVSFTSNSVVFNYTVLL